MVSNNLHSPFILAKKVVLGVFISTKGIGISVFWSTKTHTFCFDCEKQRKQIIEAKQVKYNCRDTFKNN